ncbi:tumor necrosis factor receptor superfamily member 11B-like [Argopecten irradians]|uniref:tumor necrosis factor receptor superfamily member 11B-like n=1 Tax=Argopecten irradians TaxID=31199 RepID=UPI0037222088
MIGYGKPSLKIDIWKFPVKQVNIVVCEVMRFETVLFTTLFLYSVSANPEDPKTLYEAPSGVICIRCPPGTYLFRHCTEDNTNSACKVCDDGTYNSDYNTAEYCAKCTPHCENPQLVPVQNCSYTSNLICGCPDGTHNLYPHKPLTHAVCQENEKCPPGYGFQTTGAPTKNTTCVRCKLGQTYSSTSSYFDECQPCTICEESDVMSACNLTHDQKCDQNDLDGHISSQGKYKFRINGGKHF